MPTRTLSPDTEIDAAAHAAFTAAAAAKEALRAPVLAVPAADWLAMSGRLTALVGIMADRDGVIARIGPDLGHGAPACFIPATLEVEIDAVKCMPAADLDRLAKARLTPATLDLMRRDHRLRAPVLAGALAHEAGHAAHSCWKLPKGTGRSAARAAALLEESRQEGKQIARRPSDRLFIRACISRIVSPSCAPGPDASRWEAASAAALLCARADTGLFDDHEIEPVREQVIAVVGDEDYDRLRAVWLAFHALDDDDAEGVARLGAEWCEIVGRDPNSKSPDSKGNPGVCGGMPGDGTAPDTGGDGDGDGDEDGDSGSGSGEDGDGDGDDGDGDGDGDGGSGPGETDGETGALGPLAAVMAAFAEAVEEEAAEVIDEESRPAATTGEAARRAAAAKDRDSKGKAALKIFGHGFTVTGEALRFTTRQPKPAERAAANKIARALSNARYRDRTVTVRSTFLPPGKLNGRQANLANAQRSGGIPVTAQPWKSKVRKRVERPPLSLGIAVDVSGSMRWATGPMASAAWIIAQAVERAEGRSATVTFGERVTAVTKPGERPTVVRQFEANAGHEVPVLAFTALDGALNLMHGRGARMLVVVSDGHFVADGQMSGSNEYVRALVASGCPVLWVCFAGGSSPKVPPGATCVDLTDPNTVGEVIGKAAAAALEHASA